MIKHVDELESKKSPPLHSLKLCPGSALAFCISDCPQGSSGCSLQPDWALRDTQRPTGLHGTQVPRMAKQWSPAVRRPEGWQHHRFLLQFCCSPARGDGGQPRCWLLQPSHQHPWQWSQPGSGASVTF